MKTGMGKWLFLLGIFTLLLSANGGPVGAKASVTDHDIAVGDIVELKIRARGNRVSFPYIEVIDGIKVLSRQERVTNVHTYVRGEFQRERTTLILTFAPQKDMTIPSYQIEIDGKRYHTNPIALKVHQAEDPTFSLKLLSTRKTVINGEAFLVTVRFSLKHGVEISDAPEYLRPAFQGFFVENADEGSSYDAGEHQVTELRYILTPHTDGNFTLGPAHAKIGLHERNQKENSKIKLAKRWLNKASNTLNIEVLPKQSGSDLVGRFSMHADINGHNVEANKPLELTVSISGEGNLVNFEFPEYELDGVTIYSSDAEVDIKVVEGHIRSSYRKKFVFISDKDFTLPKRSVTVYDPQTKKVETLSIDALPVTIKKPEAGKRSERKNTETKKSRNSSSELGTTLLHYVTAWWKVLLGVLLLALLFYLWRSRRKNRAKTYSEEEALKILYGHISKDPEIEEMVRRLYARKNGDRSIEIDMERLQTILTKLEEY